MQRDTIVIIGGGLAGAKAVEGARDAGFDGRIVLLTDEPHLPYERPALSKDYLRGESGAAQLRVHGDAFYVDHEIEVRTDTTVARIDRSDGAVVTTADERIPFTRLLLATGAEPRRLTIPGCELDGIHLLRTIDDADRLRIALQGATNVAVIGGGWIGAEVAASARHLDCAVTMIHHEAAPLHAILGPEVAGVYRALHAERGVVLESDSTVTAIRGTTKVEEVVTSRGTRIAADVVVAGIGATPRTDLAITAGLTATHGVDVDEHLRTSDDRVFAAGDVAAAYHPHYGTRLRVEHWANARDQGLVAGRNLAGRHEVYDALPYFYSDQYDVGMEYVGYAPEWDRVVVRGELADRKFIAFWIMDDAVVAAMNVNVWDVVEPIRHLIRTRTPIDDARLRDLDVALADVGAWIDVAKRR